MGAEVGWQPLPEGGVEYIIEISPGAVDSLVSGQAIQSDIPPAVLREIRSYRIIVGNQKAAATTAAPADPDGGIAGLQAAPTTAGPARPVCFWRKHDCRRRVGRVGAETVGRPLAYSRGPVCFAGRESISRLDRLGCAKAVSGTPPTGRELTAGRTCCGREQ